ncbi:MAG: hypothetical protein DCC75_13295 [Proteobacteria bacterium]|nr:MAG: hypothetical protein DCC75_13295 [Pseudomonadota bacterium]
MDDMHFTHDSNPDHPAHARAPKVETKECPQEEPPTTQCAPSVGAQGSQTYGDQPNPGKAQYGLA